jgi:hypothetical protein
MHTWKRTCCLYAPSASVQLSFVRLRPDLQLYTCAFVMHQRASSPEHATYSSTCVRSGCGGMACMFTDISIAPMAAVRKPSRCMCFDEYVCSKNKVDKASSESCTMYHKTACNNTVAYRARAQQNTWYHESLPGVKKKSPHQYVLRASCPQGVPLFPLVSLVHRVCHSFRSFRLSTGCATLSARFACPLGVPLFPLVSSACCGCRERHLISSIQKQDVY